MTTFGSVCSGIGAPEVAWAPLGWQPVWCSEIEAHPSTILAHRFPHVPNMGDMRQLPALVRMGLLPAPDVLVGGTPCQAYSLAGLRLGLEDERGQLTLKFVELADAIDEQRDPGDECVVVWENVPGVLSDGTNAFGHFLAGLAGEDVPLVCTGGKWPNAGLVVGPKRAIAWRVLDAQYFGVAQRRRRVFVVASARNGFDPAAVLFEFDSVRRDFAPRRLPGQEVAGAITASAGRRGGVPDCASTPGHLITLAHGHSGAEICIDHAPTLTCVHEAPILAFDCKASGQSGFGVGEISSTMRAMGRANSHQNGGGHLAVAYRTVEPAPIWYVRRLMPRECERLQGFPDDHTLVPLPDRRQPPPRGDRRTEPRMMADGPRYKALGNSMCVTLMRWLGLRLMFSGCLTR